jgi:hypothetical protein
VIEKNYVIADLGASNGRITRGSFDGKTIELNPLYTGLKL